jgi:hypothetical protein
MPLAEDLKRSKAITIILPITLQSSQELSSQSSTQYIFGESYFICSANEIRPAKLIYLSI